jgi:MinD superfamily P-loop ATPase
VGCPVIASIGGATALLIVTEPTVSGLHDMERVAQLADHFKVPSMVCVNKFDLNINQTEAIEKLAKEKNITILGRIPFDPVFTKSMVQGKTIFEYNTESIVGQAVKQIWRKIIESPVMNDKGNG